MSEPMTEAGRRLLASHEDTAVYCGTTIELLRGAVAAIEAEAVAAYAARVRAARKAAREAAQAVVFDWYTKGLIRFGSHDDGGDDLILGQRCADAALDAALDAPAPSEVLDPAPFYPPTRAFLAAPASSEPGWRHPSACSNQHSEDGNCLDESGSIVGWREALG